MSTLRPLSLCALLLTGAVLLSSCSPSTFIMEAYSGPTRPANTLAVVRVDGSGSVMLLAVDGQTLAPVASDARLHIELLPGRHTLTAQSEATLEEPPQRVSFEAQAGRFYRVSFVSAQAQPGALEARVFELEPESGASGADVTLTKPRRAAPPAPL